MKCYCEEEFSLVLQFQFNDSAIVCSNCNLDVKLDNLPTEIKRDIAIWTTKYKIAYEDWLNSSESKLEIFDPNSDVNTLGQSIVKRLNKFRKAYYWWHTYFETINNCPKCNDSLIIVANNYDEHHKVCEKCHIILNDNLIVD